MRESPPHDDSQRIVVYANRRWLARYALLTWTISTFLIGLAFASPLLAGPPSYASSGQWWMGLLIFGSFACLSLPTALSSTIRILHLSPSLIVTSRGIVDRSSNIMGGRGLLRWQEIAWVGYEIRPGSSVIRQYLIINLFQSPAASARKPVTAIPSPTSPYPFTTTVLRIGEGWFDIPVAGLVDDIERYIKQNAPSGWHGMLSEARGDSGQIINPPPDIPVGW